MAETTAKSTDSSFSFATLGAFGISAVIHALIFLVVGTVVVFESPLVTEFFVADNIDASDLSQEMEIEPVILDEQQPLPDVAPTETVTTVENSFSDEAATPADLIIASVPAPTSSAFALPKNVGSPTGTLFGNKASKGQEGAGRGVTATIFGKSIKASKLGVILDVSHSTHNLIDYAIEEIQSGFPDAILVYAPGCEISARESEIVPASEFEETYKKKYPNSKGNTTAPFINNLLKKNKNFGDIWEDSQRNGTGFVTFVDISRGGGTILGGIHQSFDFLVEQGADVIYWFADFDDNVNPDLAEDLLKRLRREGVKVMAHDFMPPLGPKKNRPNIVEQVTNIAEKTGGEFFLKTAEKKKK
jgi:hypothetical protein